jgi:hypothetical protein
MYTPKTSVFCVIKKITLFGCEFFAWNVHTKKVGWYDLIMILLFCCALCGMSIGPKLNLKIIIYIYIYI